MANSIAKFKKYIDKLDTVYQQASATSILDADADTVRMGATAGEFLIPKISMDGLADYSRSNGYVQGDVTITYENGEQVVWLNGRNVNGLIRTEEVSRMASVTSVNPKVRTKLVELQRKLAAKENVVMDGRDIGTVVLPDANVKIYLTASSAVRAKRRYEEQKAKGIDCNLEEIEKDIIERDHRDMTREISPLKQAEDAILLDSSNMTIEEVADAVIALCK